MSSVSIVSRRNSPNSNGYSQPEKRKDQGSQQESTLEEGTYASVLDLSHAQPRQGGKKLSRLSDAISQINVEERTFAEAAINIDSKAFLTALFTAELPLPLLKNFSKRGGDVRVSFLSLRREIQSLLQVYREKMGDGETLLSSVGEDVRNQENPHFVDLSREQLRELLFN